MWFRFAEAKFKLQHNRRPDVYKLKNKRKEKNNKLPQLTFQYSSSFENFAVSYIKNKSNK